MAIKACQKDGLPGFKYGDGENAVCYTYRPGDAESKRRAHKEAQDQLTAIIMSIQREEEEKKKKRRVSASIWKVFGMR